MQVNDMKNPIRNFPELCKSAMDYRTDLPESYRNFNKIMIAGMGGSAISGNVIKDWLKPFSKIPIDVSKDFFLPNWIDDKTLLFFISFSGNTEETLKRFEQALDIEPKIVVITSGGKIGDYAKKMNIPTIEIPSEGMQPRDAFPFLFFPIVNCLDSLGSIGVDYTKIGEFLEENKDKCEEIAEHAAEKMVGTMPFIYGTSEAVCMRYKTQINENAKMHAKSETYPEINHNEVVGWQGKSVGISVLFLRGIGENESTTKTMNFLRDLINKRARVLEINAKGDNWLERAFYLIYIGDLISLFLAEKQGVERERAEYIEKIKSL